MEPDKYRILIVDDEADTADILAASISALTEFNVISFDDPNKALDSFISSPVDLVISDLEMPKIDGFQMIEKMKDRNINSDYIIVTGKKTMKVVVQARWLGVSYLFFKPVDIEELIEAIQTMYKRACYWEQRLQDIGVK